MEHPFPNIDLLVDGGVNGGVPVGVGGVMQHFYADATAQLVTANVVTKKRQSIKDDDDYEDDEDLDDEFDNEFIRHRRSRGPSKKKKSRRGGDEDEYEMSSRKKFQQISPIPHGGIDQQPKKKGQGNLTDSRKLLLQINSWLVSTLQLKEGFGPHDFVDLSEFLKSVCPDTISIYVDTSRNPNVLKIHLINLENLRKVKVEDRNWIYQYIVTRVDIICTTINGIDPVVPASSGIKQPKSVQGGDKVMYMQLICNPEPGHVHTQACFKRKGNKLEYDTPQSAVSASKVFTVDKVKACIASDQIVELQDRVTFMWKSKWLTL